MGDNAKKGWEWHNTVVGEGYQAKGVIRQRTAVEQKQIIAVVDLSKKEMSSELESLSKSDELRKEKKRKHEKESKEHKKSSKKKSSKDKEAKEVRGDPFNPLLQYLATRLSNKTMHFSETN